MGRAGIARGFVEAQIMQKHSMKNKVLLQSVASCPRDDMCCSGKMTCTAVAVVIH